MRNRLIGWTIGVLAVALTVALAAEASAEWGSRGPFANRACAAPNYGETEPVCCEPRSCRCDDVWVGYCQEGGCGGFCWPAARRATEIRCETPAVSSGSACVTSATPPMPRTTSTPVAGGVPNQVTLLPPVERPR